jgi:hypothetical protein
MQSFVVYAAALAVAIIFYSWRAYQEHQANRKRTLRERVTYMLWVMTQQVEHRDSRVLVR